MSDIDFILVFIVVGCFVGLFSHISWFPPFITIRLSCGPQSHLHPPQQQKTFPVENPH